MTLQEKLNWLTSASPEELISQLKWTVNALYCGDIAQRQEAQADYKLVADEIMKRMKGAKA